MHVQGNVHMIVGAGANIAVQVGEDGVLVVDTGAAARATRCWRRSSSSRRQGDPLDRQHRIQADHIGGNEAVAKAGRTVNGNVAAIVAHENADVADDQGRRARRRRGPTTPTSKATRDFPFNGEPVILYHDESALDDADTLVMFRRSDVIAAGDLFSTVSYPVIDLAERRQRAGHDRRA